MQRGEGPAAETRQSGDDAVRTVTADDRTVAYAEYGATRGDPAAFFHGTPGSRLLGRALDDAARERGLRLLAIDRPGYGRSTPWPERTLADTGAFVTPVLDDAGVDRARLIGFSGGGPHALAVAATHGDRVRGVDVIAGAAPPDLADDQPTIVRLMGMLARTAPWLLSGLFRGQAWAAERSSPGFVCDQYTDDPDAIPEDVAETVREDFLEALARSRAGVVTESGYLDREWEIDLDRIDAPVRFWHGEADGNAPIVAARRLCDEVDGEFTAFEGEDHLTTLLRAAEEMP